MRRLLLIFLVVLLPLQFAWAGAAAYCSHEQADSQQEYTWHFGHHAHEHKADNSHDDSARPAKSAKLPDGDCNACHFPGSHGLFGEMRLTSGHHFVTVRYRLRDSAFGSIPAPVPERPQWRGLA